MVDSALFGEAVGYASSVVPMGGEKGLIAAALNVIDGDSEEVLNSGSRVHWFSEDGAWTSAGTITAESTFELYGKHGELARWNVSGLLDYGHHAYVVRAVDYASDLSVLDSVYGTGTYGGDIYDW